MLQPFNHFMHLHKVSTGMDQEKYIFHNWKNEKITEFMIFMRPEGTLFINIIHCRFFCTFFISCSYHLTQKNGFRYIMKKIIDKMYWALLVKKKSSELNVSHLF